MHVFAGNKGFLRVVVKVTLYVGRLVVHLGFHVGSCLKIPVVDDTFIVSQPRIVNFKNTLAHL